MPDTNQAAMEEYSRLLELLKEHSQHLKTAERCKGQRATDKPSRQQLESNLKRATPKTCSSRTLATAVGYAYPPSTTPPSELASVTISELRLETRHIGSVLIVRTCTEAVRFRGIRSVIEDKNFDADQLLLLNSYAKANVTGVLPENKLFAVKEPYYHATLNDGYVIRIDHPSDLVQLDPKNIMISMELKLRKRASDGNVNDSMKAGNTAFKQKNYLGALAAFSDGLSICKEKADPAACRFYLARSLVNLYLARYEQALGDANAAVITNASVDEAGQRANFEALFRAGRALYSLGRFSKAVSKFEELLQIDPDNKYGLEYLEKAKTRIGEAKTGIYDFEALSKSITPTHKRLDFANFTSSVEVRASSKKGRGLFAIHDIKSGELVFLEKAFAAVFDSEIGPNTHVLLDPNRDSPEYGADALLFYKVVQKMLHSPARARCVLALFDGGSYPKHPINMVDGTVPINIFQVAAILAHNRFGCEDTRSSDVLNSMNSVGIWVLASYMNHDCCANTFISFMGDCMIVRATRDIVKGEELFTSYLSSIFNYTECQKRLARTWKFTCTCVVCTVEAKISPEDREQRQALLGEARRFLEDHRVAVQYTEDTDKITQAQNLYSRLEADYKKHEFEQVPRRPLAHVANCFATYIRRQRTRNKLSILHNLCLETSGTKLRCKAERYISIASWAL